MRDRLYIQDALRLGHSARAIRLGLPFTFFACSSALRALLCGLYTRRVLHTQYSTAMSTLHGETAPTHGAGSVGTGLERLMLEQKSCAKGGVRTVRVGVRTLGVLEHS